MNNQQHCHQDSNFGVEYPPTSEYFPVLWFHAVLLQGSDGRKNRFLEFPCHGEYCSRCWHCKLLCTCEPHLRQACPNNLDAFSQHDGASGHSFYFDCKCIWQNFRVETIEDCAWKYVRFWSNRPATVAVAVATTKFHVRSTRASGACVGSHSESVDTRQRRPIRCRTHTGSEMKSPNGTMAIVPSIR